jgi:DtxR family Mn-dependent transcriptional regulator
MSVSTENFVKAIYQLQHDNGLEAGPSVLAGHLGISRAAITDMARKLAMKGLVRYKKYKALGLTGKGEKMAIGIIRRHRIWEQFLHEILGISLAKVHPEAEKLEHQTSEFLLEKLDEFLGHPSHDPHGDPIPDKTGKFTEPRGQVVLKVAPANKNLQIERVLFQKENWSSFFTRNKIKPGENVKILERFDNDKTLSIEINNKEIIINEHIARSIFVKPESMV